MSKVLGKNHIKKDIASKVREGMFCIAHITSAENNAHFAELRIRTAASWGFMPG